MQIELPLWLDYIERQIGFILPKNQHQWLANAINGTAVKHGLSLSELFLRVREDNEVRQSLFDSVLIAESRFFRDVGALNFVAEQYKQYLAQKHTDDFSVLSVGCSTGQEAWSLAMVLEKAYQEVRGGRVGANNPNYRVLGLDVSQTSLTIARRAHYPIASLENIPTAYQACVDMQQLGDDWQPLPAIQRKVSFEWCNVFLAQSLYDSLNRSCFKEIRPNVIICQNMLIYFRRFDQRDILGRLVDVLGDGGHLILSAVDGLFWQHPQTQRLHHEGANIWQKSIGK